jgi:hypothetical protein
MRPTTSDIMRDGLKTKRSLAMVCPLVDFGKEKYTDRFGVFGTPAPLLFFQTLSSRYSVSAYAQAVPASTDICVPFAHFDTSKPQNQ